MPIQSPKEALQLYSVKEYDLHFPLHNHTKNTGLEAASPAFEACPKLEPSPKKPLMQKKQPWLGPCPPKCFFPGR